MAQLVQLQKHSEEFRNLNTELIFVFREERQGVEGLKKIKSGSKTGYTLAVDLNKKSSIAYSPKRMTFFNYVIAKDGTVKGIIPGNLRTRATAEQLKKHLQEIEEK